MAAGANVNAKNFRRNVSEDTPLHEAARKGHKEIAELLLAKGADVNAKNAYGETVLLGVSGEVVPSYFSGSDDGRNEIVELLIANGANVNAAKDTGGTPLHFAAWSRHKEIAELLISNGANVNAKMIDGKTPLDLAHGKTANLLRKHGGKNGTILTAAAAGDFEAVKEFLDTGADVNPKDGILESTPLYAAALGGHKEIAELLLANGAGVNAIIVSAPFQGKTPLDWANGETADLLRKHGGKTEKELEAVGN